MSGFEVVAQQLRDAARQIEDAASGVRSQHPEDAVGRLAGALPGSQSAQAAASLQTAWSNRFSRWHEDAMAQGRSMSGSAESYDASDYAADARLRLMARRMGEDLY